VNVKEFAKTTLESFGIAEGTALDMAAAYGDMGTSMDFLRVKLQRCPRHGGISG
jgi:hypothetical protein